MHEIKIYGEIIPFEDAWIIEQGGYVSLTALQNQLKEAGGKDIKVRINSCGGDCDTGFAMYAELRRYAKDNNAKVETFGEARVASIATVIFLAGDSRTLTEHTEPFVHNAWTYTIGDAKTLQRAAVDLQRYNEKIAEHYALHTDLTKDEALQLMEDETAITTTEALAMRFCTSIEEVFRPAALQRFNNKQQTDMNKNPKTVSVLNKVMSFIKKLEGANNKLVMTADQTEIDFYELAEDAVVEVGAKARVNGEDAQGEYVMPDGETYIFDAGTLTEIRENDEGEEVAALQEENENLRTQLEAVVNAAQKDIEAKEALLVAKDATIATLNAQVATFKNATSAAAPQASKAAPIKTNAPAPSENKASSALANLRKLTPKK